MSTTTHYGIIGCGMMGQEHLRNIALLPDTKVSVIFEPDTGMQAEAAKFAPDAKFVDSIDALLEAEHLDCILIASPNFRHIEQLEMIGAKRPVPILVEKPLFTDPDHLARLNTFIETYPAPVWVAMEYRYMPPVAARLECLNEATG